MQNLHKTLQAYFHLIVKVEHLRVVDVSWANSYGYGFWFLINYYVYLRSLPMLESIVSYFFTPLLASTVVLSIATRLQLLMDVRNSIILSHTPASWSLLSNLHAVTYDPYFLGISRHLQPVVATYNMPLINDLSSLKALLPLLGLGGRKDEMTPHSSSVNSRNSINKISNRKIKYFETTSEYNLWGEAYRRVLPKAWNDRRSWKLMV